MTYNICHTKCQSAQQGLGYTTAAILVFFASDKLMKALTSVGSAEASVMLGAGLLMSLSIIFNCTAAAVGYFEACVRAAITKPTRQSFYGPALRVGTSGKLVASRFAHAIPYRRVPRVSVLTVLVVSFALCSSPEVEVSALDVVQVVGHTPYGYSGVGIMYKVAALRDLYAMMMLGGDIETNPGPPLRSQAAKWVEQGTRASDRGPLGEATLIVDKGAKNIALGKRGADVPAMRHLGGLPMLPTQYAVRVTSGSQASFGEGALPPSWRDPEDFGLTAGGLGATSHQMRWRRVRPYAVDELSTTEAPTMYLGRPNSLAYRVVSTAPKLRVTQGPLFAGYEALQADTPVRELRTIAQLMAGFRDTDANRVVSKTVRRLAQVGDRTCYQRFWFKVWLDTFAAAAVEADGGDHLFDFGQANQRAAMHQTTAAGALVESIANGLDTNWSNVVRGSHFFYSADEGSRDADFIGLVHRYASSWPPCPVTTLPGHAAGAGNIVNGYQVAVPGAEAFWYHTGDYDAVLNVAPRTGFETADTIRSFAAQFLKQTGSHVDCQTGFELAAAVCFRHHPNTIADPPAVGLRRRAAHRTFDAMMSGDKLHLPRDYTASEYFSVIRDIVDTASPVATLLTMRVEAVWAYGRTYSLMLCLSRSAAFKACNIAARILSNVGNIAADAAEMHHLSELCSRHRRVEISELDVITQNACGHLFGFIPQKDVFRAFDLLDDSDRPDLLIDAWFPDHEMPHLIAPPTMYAMMRAAFDYMVLPSLDGHVKWPENKAYPVRHGQSALEHARLGQTFGPTSTRLWIGDGGHEYSANYYAANNASDTHDYVADGAGNNINVCYWEKPREFNLPAQPNFVEPRRMLQFPDYLVPGWGVTYNPRVRNTIAWGVQTDDGARSRVWTDVARKQRFTGPSFEIHSDRPHVPETDSLIDYCVYELIDSETRRPIGLGLVPTHAPPQASPPVAADHGGAAAGGAANIGPAHEMNDNSPQYESAPVTGFDEAGGSSTPVLPPPRQAPVLPMAGRSYADTLQHPRATNGTQRGARGRRRANSVRGSSGGGGGASGSGARRSGPAPAALPSPGGAASNLDRVHEEINRMERAATRSRLSVAPPQPASAPPSQTLSQGVVIRGPPEDQVRSNVPTDQASMDALLRVTDQEALPEPVSGGVQDYSSEVVHHGQTLNEYGAR
ncbi:hypothetical protein [Phytophthora pluvialis RNA virus 1]|nr:hypothetical protein [Phytophthora pluvialis RNA virus 1]